MTAPDPPYAHTPPDEDSDWHLLKHHLADVATLASRFAQPFGASEWARLSGMWHDLGKYSAAFQSYLHQSASGATESATTRGPDHSTAGAQHAATRCSGIAGRILAYCIAGHHGGLPDNEDSSGGRSGLLDRLRKTVEPYDAAPRELLDATDLTMPRLSWGDTGTERSFQCSVFCRMLFSCLVDADFLDTERFMRPNRAAARRGDVAPAPCELLDVLNAHLVNIETSSERSPVNTHRRAVLQACRAKASQPPGLFSLTVPTGGGKTLSSLAFALTHAAHHGLRRVIFAIPFTSIIEQNAEVFRDALAAAGDDVVLEHHCNYERKTSRTATANDGEFYWDWLASENWDAPVVVTTNVQLFESLFANKPSRCRKLHRIAGSVIVLDEVQTLPVQLLRPTLAMLTELCRNYGCTVLFCSATQPAVALREGFPIGLSGVREIVDDPPALFQALKRVAVERIGETENDALAARIETHDQVLCVVNTRDHAADLFRLLTGDAFHLSARMCPAHRKDVLEQIKKRLDKKSPCRVVSTQLVEAGVDIDFPIVYRAMTGIDSIAQAAGRCNREGALDCGHVFVFETDVNPKGDLQLRRDKGREVAGLHGDLLSLEAVGRFFRLIYWSQKDEWDKYDVMRCFRQAPHFQFREAAKKYRLIRDEQQPIIIPYGDEGTLLIDELKSMREPPSRGFARRAQRFTVSVYQYQLAQMRDATLINQYHDRYWVLEDPSAYDNDLGLRTNAPGRDPETLIV